MKCEILGIIPARAGSKGVPQKNRRLVGGRPLIQYSIDVALRSKQLTRIVVSTDDPVICDLARVSGIEVVERPVGLAGDASAVIDAVRHVIETSLAGGRVMPEAIVLLQPTAPLRKVEDIDNAVQLFFDNNMNPVCSVSRCEDNHPARMYRLDSSGRLEPLMPEFAGLRRQELPPIYHRNGAIYVFGRRELDAGQIIVPGMTPWVMDARQSLNVDTEFDLLVLDTMVSQK